MIVIEALQENCGLLQSWSIIKLVKGAKYWKFF